MIGCLQSYGGYPFLPTDNFFFFYLFYFIFYLSKSLQSPFKLLFNNVLQNFQSVQCSS
jgi:hypothetical protein